MELFENCVTLMTFKFIVVINICTIIIAQDHENCWEKCFQVNEMDKVFREIYFDIYSAGMEARRLKNIYNIDGTAIFIDSKLAKYRNKTRNNLQSTTNAEENEGFMNTLEIQTYLASILAVLIEAGSDNDGDNKKFNPVFSAQFNSDRAWSCTGHQCMTYCQAMTVFSKDMSHFSVQTDFDVKQGNIEAGCSLIKNYMDTAACKDSLQNQLAIAIINSNMFHKHQRKSKKKHKNIKNNLEFNEYYPCATLFSHRMVIGTHIADHENMKQFHSTDAEFFYLFNNELTLEATKKLFNCLEQRCCAGSLPFVNPGSCEMTNGKVGQIIANFPDHEALMNDS